MIIESVCLTVKSSDKSFYNTVLVDKLCDILQSATRQGDYPQHCLLIGMRLFFRFKYSHSDFKFSIIIIKKTCL